MLTKKQNELLIYINQNLRETGVAPSYEEMREALDLRSKSGIHRLINALEEDLLIEPELLKSQSFHQLPLKIKMQILIQN